ncbi:hypothetical protein Mapa_016222 [Marchantia paleacea]|nr:hypothetical protein Mapa_016222 [Marchantia paleacea]
MNLETLPKLELSVALYIWYTFKYWVQLVYFCSCCIDLNWALKNFLQLEVKEPLQNKNH